jgi:chromosome segregation ATPase
LLKNWEPTNLLTHTKDEEDCGDASFETLSATESSYGAPSVEQEEQRELGEYPKQVCEPLTERNKPLTKLRSLYRQPIKEYSQLYGKFETLKGNLYVLAAYIEKTAEDIKALNLDVESIRDQCKEADVIEKQLNLLAETCEELRRNKDAVIYEAECLSEEAEITRKNMDELKLKVENIRQECKEAEKMEKQLNFVTLEREQLVKYQETLMHEVECISEEIEETERDIGDLKFKVENIREQCKEAETIENQTKLATAEDEDLKRFQETLIHEVECILEEIEATKRDIGDLKLMGVNLSQECNKAETMGKQTKLVTNEGEGLRKNKDSIIYQAECLSEDSEVTMKNIDELKVENIGEECDEAQMEKQLNFVTLERDQLVKYQETLMHEVKCILEDIEETKKDIGGLKLMGGNFSEERNEAETMTGEGLRKSKDAVIYQAECLSEEGDFSRNMDELKLKIENISEQVKEIETMENQMKFVTAEGQELKNKDAVIYQAECLSEKAEVTMKNMDELRVKIENIREQYKEATTLQKLLNFVSEQGDQLSGRNEQALTNEAKSLSKDVKMQTEDMDFRKDSNRSRTLKLREII